MEKGKPGSQPIGSLISQTVSTLRVVDGTPGGSERRPMPLRIGADATRRSSPTGMQPGVPGAETPTSSLPAILPEQTAWTAQSDPARLLPQCVQSSLAATWDDERTAYGWDGYVEAYELVRPVPEEDRQVAISLAEAMLRPATEALLITELGRLRAMTVSRDVGQDLSLLFAVYADELRRGEYPADAILEVLRGWPRTERFWPSIAELISRLDRLVKPRLALLEGLRRGYREPELSPDWTPASEAEKAQVGELLAEAGIEAQPRHERPIEAEELTPEVRRRIAAEMRSFRLPPEDDQRVQARLREMEAS